MSNDSAEQEFHGTVPGGEMVGWVGGGGPPALLLHGGPGLSDYLSGLAAELSPVMTVARYQQRGLAPSVVEGDRTVDGHVADAVAVLDALGWGRAWVIGHSWGGHLAMHLAVAHRERLIGMVAFDALGAVPDGGTEALGTNLMRDLPEPGRSWVEAYSKREEAGGGTAAEAVEALRILWPYYFGNPATATPMPEMRMDLDGHLTTWRSVMEHFEIGTLERGLPQLRMPTLVLHGAASPIPASEAERTAALIPGASLRILQGIGHFAWIEEPGSARREIEAFLAAAVPAGRA